MQMKVWVADTHDYSKSWERNDDVIIMHCFLAENEMRWKLLNEPKAEKMYTEGLINSYSLRWSAVRPDQEANK